MHLGSRFGRRHLRHHPFGRHVDGPRPRRCPHGGGRAHGHGGRLGLARPRGGRVVRLGAPRPVHRLRAGGHRAPRACCGVGDRVRGRPTPRPHRVGRRERRAAPHRGLRRRRLAVPGGSAARLPSRSLRHGRRPGRVRRDGPHGPGARHRGPPGRGRRIPPGRRLRRPRRRPGLLQRRPLLLLGVRGETRRHTRGVPRCDRVPGER